MKGEEAFTWMAPSASLQVGEPTAREGCVQCRTKSEALRCFVQFCCQSPPSVGLLTHSASLVLLSLKVIQAFIAAPPNDVSTLQTPSPPFPLAQLADLHLM